MPEQKAAQTDKNDDRSVMNKRVERKDDGRILIYYKFDEKPAPADSSSLQSSDKTAGAQ